MYIYCKVLSARHGKGCRFGSLIDGGIARCCTDRYSKEYESGKNTAKELGVRFQLHGSGFPYFTNLVVKACSLAMHI